MNFHLRVCGVGLFRANGAFKYKDRIFTFMSVIYNCRLVAVSIRTQQQVQALQNPLIHWTVLLTFKSGGCDTSLRGKI